MKIKERLVALQKKFALSISDLAVLLECNRSTVFGWVNGVEPSETRKTLIEKKIAEISRAGKYFPVPLHITQYQRKTYLLEALNGRPSQLSKQNTAARKRGV